MKKEENILLPLPDELPSSYADRLGVYYTSTVENGHKKELGQFFTPKEIARFMGDLHSVQKDEISILDPGCGTGILTCALVESLINKNSNLSEIEIQAYETDLKLIRLSEQVFSYLKNWASLRGVNVHFVILIADFILQNADSLIHEQHPTQFDIIIANPPYFKLSKDDPRAVVAQRVIYGQPNIYSIFLSIAAQLLNSTGELIFISPRSFASGHYFKLFRKFFFNTILVERVHLFHSRRDTFTRDNVLQETLIIKGRKRNSEMDGTVIVSSSNGLKDLENPLLSFYPINELIDLKSREKILHLPTNSQDEFVIKLFKTWSGNLAKYNIQISTGPVVSFRERKNICDSQENGSPLAPLYWLHNVCKMQFEWPVARAGKGQYIQISEATRGILLPNKNYILLRRFSSKDDKSRLIASPYFYNPNDGDFIGVENKLNYLYRPKGHLSRNEVLGLSALLNSSIFDCYFRTFNGNTNVSATELREMPLPDLELIRKIGDQLIIENNFSETKIEEIIEHFLELQPIINEQS